MNMIKKCIAIIMCALMLVLSLASCGNANNGPSVTTVTPTGVTTPADNKDETPSEIFFDMVDPEGNVCYIVYPDGSDNEVYELANKTSTRLKTILGQRVPVVIPDTQMQNNPGSYICIGNVNIPEAAELSSEYKYADTGFKVFSQDLICIAGHSYEYLNESVKLFWNTFGKSISDTKVLSDGSTVSGRFYPASASKTKVGSYNISALTIGGVEASQYKVIYASDEDKPLAEIIRDTVGKASGAVLSVAPDTDAEVANEILVGATNRVASKKYENTELHNYNISIEAGKMIVQAPHEIIKGIAADYITSTLFTAEGENKTLELTAENNILGTTTKEGFDLLGKDDGDIRILSTNLYFEKQSRERAETYLNILPLYNADFICIQEMDSLWHLLLDNEIPKLGYTAVPTIGQGEYASKKHADNFTPIYYRADKYKLIDGGYQPFSSVKDTKENVFVKYPELAKLSDTQKQKVLNEYTKNGVTYGCVGHLSKSFSWAVFESLENGERFCVISTHMTHDNSATIANVRRMYDVKEVLAKKDAIAAEYNIPVMILGDFNFNSTETPYKIMKDGNMQESFYTCDVRESFYTGHTLGEMPSNLNGNPIDMCFHTEGIDANKIQIIVNEHTAFYSDHFPITFDFNIK